VVLACQGEKSGISYKTDTILLLLLLLFVCFSFWRKFITKIMLRSAISCHLHGQDFGMCLPTGKSLMPSLRTMFWSTSHCHEDREHPSVKTVQMEEIKEYKRL